MRIYFRLKYVQLGWLIILTCVMKILSFDFHFIVQLTLDGKISFYSNDSINVCIAIMGFETGKVYFLATKFISYKSYLEIDLLKN